MTEYSMPPSPPEDLSGLAQLAEIATRGIPTSLMEMRRKHPLFSSFFIQTPLPPLPSPPPQESPLDLRIDSKIRLESLDLEYKERRDSVGTDSGESSCSEGEERERKGQMGFQSIYKCEECGKGYSSSSNLARHRQTHRPDQSLRSCSVCSKEYSSPAALSMHLRTHTNGCKCPFCGKSFSRPWLLQGHIRTHTGEKPFTCHLCNKAFADKSNLRAHIQTHSTDKPFNCSKCNKAFALKSYLSKHEESSCLKTEKNERVFKRQRRDSSETETEVEDPTLSASSHLSLTRLLSSPSLLQSPIHNQISEATLQALKLAVLAGKIEK